MRRVNWVLDRRCSSAAVGLRDARRDAQARQARRGRWRAARARRGAGRDRVAELGAKIEELERTVDGLNGRLDEIERQAKQALEEAQAARSEANQAPGGARPPARARRGRSGAPTGDARSQEVQSYRDAHAKWRDGDAAGCVDLFGKFLQTYPASDYADDATYWLADCYFKQGNFSAAVLRFDDVARQYPSSDKAAGRALSTGRGAARAGSRHGGGQRIREGAARLSQLAARARGEAPAPAARERELSGSDGSAR